MLKIIICDSFSAARGMKSDVCNFLVAMYLLHYNVILSFPPYNTVWLKRCILNKARNKHIYIYVHCGHRVQWIPDTFACLDRWMSLLLTDNASPGSSDGTMPGFLVEEGRGHLALSWPLQGPLVNDLQHCAAPLRHQSRSSILMETRKRIVCHHRSPFLL